MSGSQSGIPGRVAGERQPSAPPAGVPVCPRGFDWCGVAPCDNARCEELHDHRCQNCRTNGRPLNPPPSDPVTVATGGDECPGCDDHCEDEKCKAAHGPCVDAAVATGGVPAGFRLGAGWVVDRTYLCSCTGCRQNTSTEYYKPRSCGKGACAAHAVRMGALVPIDTARSVPPGPVPETLDDLAARPSKTHAEASARASAIVLGAPGPVPVEADVELCPGCTCHREEPGECPHHGKAPPAEPASEPAVRPVANGFAASRAAMAVKDITPVLTRAADILEWMGQQAIAIEARGDKKVAALEADLAEAKRRHAGAAGMYQVVSERWKASRAEVEQLRGKLEAEKGIADRRQSLVQKTSREATDRVRSMREAAAKVARDLRCLALAEAIRALPLDTGTATDAGGEAPTYDDLSRVISELGLLLAKYEKAQADAITAAVDKERNRCIAAYLQWSNGPESDPLAQMDNETFAEWLRSGEDAPGAVGK